VDITVQDINWVFTPASPASTKVFAERANEDLQARVGEALLDAGSQLILYGPTGVGKTSLVHNVCAALGLSTVVVNAGGPFNRMLDDVLAQLEPDVRTGHEEVDGGGASLKVGLSVAQAKLDDRDELRTQHARRPPQLTRQVLDVMTRTRTKVLFIDNFESLDGQRHRGLTVQRLSEMLKFFSDSAFPLGVDAPTIVIAGIGSAAEDLVVLDEAIARRTVQAEVPRMTPQELATIVHRGGEELSIDFADVVTQTIVEWSDGFPSYTHLFARHAAIAALTRPDARLGPLFRKRLHVTMADVQTGVFEAVRRDQLRQTVAYRDAVAAEPFRRAILSALASCTSSEATLKEIRHAVRAASAPDTKVENRGLRTALSRLSKGDGSIVVCRERATHPPLFRFRDPLMRAYVRLEDQFAFTSERGDDQQAAGD
jgi:ATPase family associated with various cellular activities (AAA)